MTSARAVQNGLSEVNCVGTPEWLHAIENLSLSTGGAFDPSTCLVLELGGLSFAGDPAIRHPLSRLATWEDVERIQDHHFERLDSVFRELT